MKNALLLLMLIIVAALAVLQVPLGCEGRPISPDNLEVQTMRLGSERFHLEVADTPATRRKGLMFRKSMAANHGMIFVFPEAQEQSFWMRNTRIPLDIVYVGADGRIVSIKQMKPYDLTGVPSDGPAMYAIELNQGRAAEVGLKVGDVLKLPESLAAKD